MRGVLDSLRSAEGLLSKKKAKAKVQAAGVYDPSKAKAARIYVATGFPAWQNQCVDIVQSCWNESNNSINEVQMKQKLEQAGLIKDKKAMPFCQTFRVGPFL